MAVQSKMPRISQFFGITIYMYHGDHDPPHFHAKYAGREAQLSIETLDILKGALSRRARGLVVDWALQYREELLANWELARQGRDLMDIPPLD